MTRSSSLARRGGDDYVSGLGYSMAIWRGTAVLVTCDGFETQMFACGFGSGQILFLPWLWWVGLRAFAIAWVKEEKTALPDAGRAAP